MNDSEAAAAAAFGIIGLVFFVLWFAVFVFAIACWWKVFTKAGKPGWACIVPIYNGMVLAEIVGRPSWWGILLYVPLVSIVFGIIILIDLAKSFGKDVGYAIGLLLLSIVFLPMLAFGSATYQGPAAKQA